MLLKNSNHMVGIMLRFKIQQQRRIPIRPQRRRRKNRALQTMRGLLGQNAPR